MAGLSEIFLQSALALLVGTLIGGALTRWLYRPNLVFDDVTVHEATREGPDRVVNMTLQVSNSGRVAAKETVGFITAEDIGSDDTLDDDQGPFPLERVEFTDEEQSEEPYATLTPSRFRPIDRELLCWAPYGNPSEYTINPGAKTVLEVAKAVWQNDRERWYLVLPTERGWTTVRGRFVVSETLATITVSPENGRHTWCEVRMALPAAKSGGAPTLDIVHVRKWWQRRSP